jgi:ketosteroid isomerase-like protein
VIEPTLEKMEHFHLQLDEILEADEHVIALGTFRGRCKESGADLHAPFAHIFNFRGDRIVRFRNFTDTAHWLHALHGEGSSSLVAGRQEVR